MAKGHQDNVDLLDRVKKLAIEYYDATHRPLGVTGEVAEYEAARLLGVTLADVRTPGYDAVEQGPDGERRIQIKGRRRSHPNAAWGRVGAIDCSKEFDSVMLVLLDERFETVEIREALAKAVRDRLEKPGSKARNERRQMSEPQFRSISCRRWPD